MNDTFSCLRLARSQNIGKTIFFRLINIFGSAKKALEQLENPDFTASFKQKISLASKAQIQQEIEQSSKFGAEIISYFDAKYPRLLKQIPDPAPILTVKGEIDFFAGDIISIVGPRNASFNAINLAKKIALELGQHSIIIASGLARGVDTAAHEAAILSGTIAVIGGGIDHVYPKENEKLFAEISQRGLLVSENAFGSVPKGGNFIQRNRIISGISMAVILVEAGLKSGSLTTARFAVEQGREVIAVPGSPFDPRCQGTNRLIRDGATMFESIENLVENLADLKRRFSGSNFLSDVLLEDFVFAETKIPNEMEMQQIREEILQKLSFAPIAIEEIIQHMKIAPKLVNIALVQLELAEKIVVNLGKVVLRSY